MHHYHCHYCNQLFERAQVASHKGKALGCATGLAVGASTKNAWAAIGAAVVGTLLGAIIDETVTPECPLCGTILKLVVSNVLA